MQEFLTVPKTMEELVHFAEDVLAIAEKDIPLDAEVCISERDTFRIKWETDEERRVAELQEARLIATLLKTKVADLERELMNARIEESLTKTKLKELEWLN